MHLTKHQKRTDMEKYNVTDRSIMEQERMF